MQETRFRAMGTDCHVLVASAFGPLEPDLLTLATMRVELLEKSWSRFLPLSELSQLNAHAGAGPMAVSDHLERLVLRMHEAWVLTEGLFDPTVLTSMTRLGYDADFAEVIARTGRSIADADVLPSPGMSGVRVDTDQHTVTLPAGVGIDPGAIGKGLAADIVADELIEAGATAALVNLGGDIAIRGELDAPWVIGVVDERLPAGDADRTREVMALPEGTDAAGIATSTTLKRRWAQGRRHHVIDPRTGMVAETDLVQVTVMTREAWWAEVLATAALLHSDPYAWLARQDVSALLIDPVRVTRIDTRLPRHGELTTQGATRG